MNTGKILPVDREIEDNLKAVQLVILVMSGKGGVGKSTVAANLALCLSVRGKAVGLLDCDIHGPSIPKLLGITAAAPELSKEGIIPILVPPRVKVMSMAFLLPSTDSPVIWRGPAKMKAVKDFLGQVQWGELDYLIIDLPPGTGDEPLSIAQLIPDVDGVIIVTTPQDVALLSVRKSITFARILNMPVLGIVENMSGFQCPHCGKDVDVFGSGGGERAASDMNVSFLGKIPLDTAIAESGDEGTPFVLCNTSLSQAFGDVVSTIEKQVEENTRKEGD
ncbi:MAG: Mrp/NBP35 family ATP-binding protein [Theionarchaea archaeon]|nr:Mrp/NBP35 family ATP-binding protein [Theionarchaea archaeon]MBU7038741.1 Mrp/NBP35 family ATP-binding protein [Theionarchaea archaeon]